MTMTFLTPLLAPRASVNASFLKGTQTKREAGQTQPKVRQNKKPYKNTATLHSLILPSKMNDQGLQGQRREAPWFPSAIVPQVLYMIGTHPITTFHRCPYKHRCIAFLGSFNGVLWLVSVWERILTSTVRSEAWTMDTTDRGSFPIIHLPSARTRPSQLSTITQLTWFLLVSFHQMTPSQLCPTLNLYLSLYYRVSRMSLNCNTPLQWFPSLRTLWISFSSAWACNADFPISLNA